MSSIISASSADDILDYFKRHPFTKGLLPFQATVNTLENPVPLIYAKQDGRQRWVICEKATSEPAIFSYAAIFAQSDHPETGNYVPWGEVTPFGVEPKTVQVRPNLKCFYTYVFDTFVDFSLYEGQWALDTYMTTVPGFNAGDLPRREYLSGHEEKYRSRFWMQTPIFMRRGANEKRGTAPGQLHEWVKKVDRDSSIFKANPDRPRLWAKDGNDIAPLAERTPSTLLRGDVVAVSFTVTYHVTSVNWFPQFHPADIVLLKPWGGDATDYSGPALNLHSRPAPVFEGFAVDEDYGAAGAPQTSMSATVTGGDPGEQKVGDGESQGSSSGTLEGDASEGTQATEQGVAETGTVAEGHGKARDESQRDVGEGFEMIGPDGRLEGRTSDETPDDIVPEGDRRPLKPAGPKSNRAPRKTRS